MAEMVLRRKRRKEGMLDAPGRRWRPTAAQVKRWARFALEACPGALLAMADVMTVPSGLHAAYAAALAAMHRPVLPAAAGGLAAMLLRMISGLDPRWEGIVTLILVMASPLVVHGRGNLVLMGYTALAMLPTAIAGFFAPTAGDMLRAWSAMPLSALSAPLLYRGLKALHGTGRDAGRRSIDSMEDRVCVGYLAAMLTCGGARLLLLGVNAGVLAASVASLALAMHLGVGTGCAAGMIGGVTLALQGLPMLLAPALAMGGFVAGVMQALGRRWLSCAGFAVSALLTMLLSGTAGLGCGAAAVLAAIGLAWVPRSAGESLKAFCRRFVSVQQAPGDAYAASMLAAWEKTVDAMAMAVPSPVDRETQHSGAWWEQRLCDGCQDRAECACMRTDLAAQKAQTVWDCRDAEDPVWQDALEELRGLGCQRLYHLRESMDSLRREEAANRRSIRNALHQRNMLVTHLSAMAGAARRFAMLSGGECWWDEVTARRIRRVLADSAWPARLSWVRRVQGHAQAAFELEFITGARRQAEELREMTGGVIGADMEVSRVDADRVWLAERPLLEAACGVCARSAGDNLNAECGDTAWAGRLQDGRFAAALSDGMGHGERAALCSRQTVELLRLCLDAGYTRRQTLTAVNGMMLLSSHGELFTTVDMLTIDLWSGQATLDKLGAAASWLHQQGGLRQLTGDALPLGIIESIESRDCSFRLVPGDTVLLMTDGVEEAFEERSELESAIWLALEETDADAAAQSLMNAAYQAQGGVSRDDQTVVVIRISGAEGVQMRSDGV